LEELLSSANGYLVQHSPKDIFDVTIAFFVPENVDFGILCHTFDILNQVICVIVLMAAILHAILNLTYSARDPDCPPKFFLHTQGCTTRIKSQNEGTSNCTQDPPQPQSSESPAIAAGCSNVYVCIKRKMPNVRLEVVTLLMVYMIMIIKNLNNKVRSLPDYSGVSN